MRTGTERVPHGTLIRTALGAALLMLSGCIFSGRAGLLIVNGAQRTQISIPATGFREVVVSVDGHAGSFRTLERVGDRFCLRTRNLSGEEVGELEIPLFSTGYCGRTAYALSPDGKKLVYCEATSGDLVVYDAEKAETSSLLVKAFAKRPVRPHGIEWLHADRIVILLSSGEIASIDVESKRMHCVYRAVSLARLAYSISPSRRYLAFWEGDAPYSTEGKIAVMDLETEQIVMVIPQARKGTPFWRPDETAIAYTHGEVIRLIPFGDHHATAGEHLAGHLLRLYGFWGNDWLAYGVKNKNRDPGRRAQQTLLNVSTGERLPISVLVSGGVHSIGTDRAVVEVGY